MKKEIILLFLVSLVFCSDYQFCNVTHIHFFTNANPNLDLQVVNYGDIVGQVVLKNYSGQLFYTNSSNNLISGGENSSYIYLNSDSGEKTYFNGHTGYRLKTSNTCNEDLHLGTELDPAGSRYGGNNIQSLDKYGLLSDYYLVQDIHSNGSIIPNNELNLSKVFEKITCTTSFDSYNFGGKTIIFPKNIIQCASGYIINQDSPTNGQGRLIEYPIFQLFEHYKIVNYIEIETRKLDAISNQVPEWGDFSSRTSNCTNDTLTNLSQRMQLIAELQETLSEDKQSIQAIVSQDYLYLASARGINNSEITYSLIPRFISAQNSLELKSEQVSNKLKLSQDSHKDLISLCLQSRAFEVQQQMIRESKAQEKTNDLLQWIAIILAIVAPFVLHYLETIKRVSLTELTRTNNLIAALIVFLILVPLYLVFSYGLILIVFLFLIVPTLAVLITILSPTKEINEWLERNVFSDVIYVFVMVLLVMTLIEIGYVFVIVSGFFDIKSDIQTDGYMQGFGLLIVLTLIVLVLALLKKINQIVINSKSRVSEQPDQSNIKLLVNMQIKTQKSQEKHQCKCQMRKYNSNK